MRLAIAPGSRGYYRVDLDGLVYTARSHTAEQIPPGERPTGHEQQFVGATCVRYWLPKSYSESLTDEQLVELFGEDDEVVEYVCSNCGCIGPLAEFDDDCTPGWTHGTMIRVTGRVIALRP